MILIVLDIFPQKVEIKGGHICQLIDSLMAEHLWIHLCVKTINNKLTVAWHVCTCRLRQFGVNH